MKDFKQLVKQIELLAAEQGLSTAELARRAGISQPTAHRIMSGQSKNPKIANVYSLAAVVGLSIPGVAESGVVYNVRLSVPVLDVLPSGGLEKNGEYILCPFEQKGEVFAFIVTPAMGGAMQQPSGRSYPEGSYVFVDKWYADKCVHGDIVAVHVQPEGVFSFRILNRLGGAPSLIALNSAYPPITSEFSIVGKVLGAVLT